jgi:hypothetical protein
MSDNETQQDVKYKYICGPNQIHPALVGVSNNLILFPWSASAGRLYMAGNMIPKSVVTSGADERMMVTGFEWKQGYAQTARQIVAPANMQVEEVFFVGSQDPREMTDAWNKVYVIYKNDEKNMYDILELPRYNTQNTYVGFEFVYDKDVMRKLMSPLATFPKGTVFAKSPRISESGEWCFGMNTRVAAISSHVTEEDAIQLTRSYAEERLKCMFKHERGFQWNEEEFVPLMLYKDAQGNDCPFPQSGQRIREDGIVMGFRRRITENSLVSLTRKALRIPDLTYDQLFYAPINSEVMSVEVLSDRMKNRANNRGTDYIEQPHNILLERYEKKQNEMHNNVIRWYERRIANNRGNDIPITLELDTFINSAYGNYTRNTNTGKINPLSRGIKRVKLKDWNINILLREIVPGKIKFKFAGLNGDKGVAVSIIEDHMAPTYADGTRAEVIINNTPAFRRQIYSMLMELSINYINVNIQKEARLLRNLGQYAEAYAMILEFCETGFPEFGEIVRATYTNADDIKDYVDHCCDKMISIHVRSNTRLYGVAIINALRAKYPFKPQKATFMNSLGEYVETVNPILISNQHFMMLDKFGTDMSAQALPKSNLFGMPAKLNDSSKYSSWLRDQGNRNTGETEGRLRTSQHGGQETAKQLAMAYSPDLRKVMVRRIIRADDPFNIDQIVKPDEYQNNRAVKMAASMLSDSGYTIRHELPTDRTMEPINNLLDMSQLSGVALELAESGLNKPEPEPAPPAEPRYSGKRLPNPVAFGEDLHMTGVTGGTDNIYGGL